MIFTQDLLFSLNIGDSFCHWSHKISKINFLQWAGLRHSIPLKITIPCPSTASPLFSIDDYIFDVRKKKSKDYYSLLMYAKKHSLLISFVNCRMT